MLIAWGYPIGLTKWLAKVVRKFEAPNNSLKALKSAK
jgi:hypothetical protein